MGQNKNKNRKTYILIGIVLFGFLLLQIDIEDKIDHKNVIATYYSDMFGDEIGTINESMISELKPLDSGSVVNVTFWRNGRLVRDRVMMSSDGSKVLSVESRLK